MKRHALLCAVGLLILMPRANAQKPFTLEQVMSAPFLTAAKNSNRVAWVLDQEGRRNIWAAEGPGFTARQITKSSEDDGQELSNLSFSADSNTIVYVRGEGKNAAGQVPNPTSDPAGTEQAVWTVAWSGGEPKRVERRRAQARGRRPFAADFSARNDRLREGWADLDRPARRIRQAPAVGCSRAKLQPALVSRWKPAGLRFRAN